ncbi:MAG: PTS sugar transporter subunit IIA [Kiritimatiellaeota bacterium]|nr:PTS sugar transporter subunit IIA [Kiritimatiellota bacterium]
MSLIKLSRLVSVDRVLIENDLETTKEKALKRLCELSKNEVGDLDEFRSAIFAREAIVSTGLGAGTAFPHVKIPSVPEFFVTLGVFPNGVEWDSLDGGPVRIVFLIGGPEEKQQRYLGILSKLSLVAKNPATRERLVAASSPEALIEIFKRY